MSTTKPIIPERIYIGNVDYKASEQDIADLVADYAVTEVVLPAKAKRANDDRPARHLGFAFVQFQTEADADSAVEKLHHTDFRGRQIFIKKAVAEASPEEKAERAALRKAAKTSVPKKQAKPKTQAEPKTQGPPSTDTVFVTNLAAKTTLEDLLELFKDCNPKWGRIPQRRLPARIYREAKEAGLPRPTLNKAFGFVGFETEADQLRAVQTLNGAELNGKPIGVEAAVERPEKIAKEAVEVAEVVEEDTE